MALEANLGEAMNEFKGLCRNSSSGPSRRSNSGGLVLTSRASILVVEDDAAIRSAVVTIPELEDYSEAATFEQGMAMVHGVDYDVLLLDLALPGGDGLDILASLRSARNFVPVLILTARGAESEWVRGLRAGADDYLWKPFGSDEMAARVEALLRRSGAKAQRLAGPLILGAVAVDVAKQRASWPAGGSDLSSQEVELLQLLAERQQAVVPRSEVHAFVARAAGGFALPRLGYGGAPLA